MKAVALALSVAAMLLPLRANILANGDFAEGHAHWRGDAQDIISTDLTNPSPHGGVTITLKKDAWTKIYQTFPARDAKARWSITFSLSSDYHVDPADEKKTGFDIKSIVGLEDSPGFPTFLATGKATWLLIFVGPHLNISGESLQPDEHKSGPQTLTGAHAFGPIDVPDMLIIVAFPPGQGTVTLTKVSLTPADK